MNCSCCEQALPAQANDSLCASCADVARRNIVTTNTDSSTLVRLNAFGEDHTSATVRNQLLELMSEDSTKSARAGGYLFLEFQHEGEYVKQPADETIPLDRKLIELRPASRSAAASSVVQFAQWLEGTAFYNSCRRERPSNRYQPNDLGDTILNRLVGRAWSCGVQPCCAEADYREVRQVLGENGLTSQRALAVRDTLAAYRIARRLVDSIGSRTGIIMYNHYLLWGARHLSAEECEGGVTLLDRIVHFAYELSKTRPEGRIRVMTYIINKA